MRTSKDAPGIAVLDVVERDKAIDLRAREVVPTSPTGLGRVSTRDGALAVLLWDQRIDLPDPMVLGRLLGGPCHVWHAGLLLGQGGRPDAWNTICHGRSMLSRDVDGHIESTSWKVSPRAVLVRNQVIDCFGGFDARFDTASGSALETGLRWHGHGALLRHVPDLLPEGSTAAPDDPPTAADGIRIVQRQLGTKWSLWAIGRGLRGRMVRLGEVPAALQAVREPLPARPKAFGLAAPLRPPEPGARVTVLVPTVGRYPYVEKLIGQLSEQTRAPDEVIVVDQNPADQRRDLTLVAPGLALQVLHLLPPGQCTARNLGLQASTGSHILFLDDDDEVPPDLIERHLEVLADREVAVSCGLVDDAESGPAPASMRYRQAATVFPTNNTMIRRSILEATGLFDPTYDRGARADHDLGMRSYLAGNLHVADPRPQVFHHHAPMGGLRTHGARIRTRRNSRSTLKERHLRTPTDIYLGLRYHSERQVREDLALSAFSTLGGQGSAARRLARLAIQLALLPSTLAHNRAVYPGGRELFDNRPPIPRLGERP